jgi:hypothetical protein
MKGSTAETSVYMHRMKIWTPRNMDLEYSTLLELMFCVGICVGNSLSNSCRFAKMLSYRNPL